MGSRLPDRLATALNRLSLLNQRPTAPETAKVEQDEQSINLMKLENKAAVDSLWL
jgi:hypothetical protein